MSIIIKDATGQTIFRQTYTQYADSADDFFAKIVNELSKTWEWIDISPSMPILINGYLKYTATITAGNFV